MASLTGIFKAVPEPPQQDNDKLVDLFRNRAELKKEFASLREEKYRLQDHIKEHRASIERVEQKLNHLESLLLDPEWVHNVVTFYQLRRLSAHCASRVARFAEQLKQQREKRVFDKVLDGWRAEQERARAQADNAIGEQRMEVQRLEDQLQAERHRLDMMGGLSRMMKGKAQAEAIESIEQQILQAHSRESELLYELERIENAEPPRIHVAQQAVAEVHPPVLVLFPRCARSLRNIEEQAAAHPEVHECDRGSVAGDAE